MTENQIKLFEQYKALFEEKNIDTLVDKYDNFIIDLSEEDYNSIYDECNDYLHQKAEQWVRQNLDLASFAISKEFTTACIDAAKRILSSEELYEFLVANFNALSTNHLYLINIILKIMPIDLKKKAIELCLSYLIPSDYYAILSNLDLRKHEERKVFDDYKEFLDEEDVIDLLYSQESLGFIDDEFLFREKEQLPTKVLLKYRGNDESFYEYLKTKLKERNNNYGDLIVEMINNSSFDSRKLFELFYDLLDSYDKAEFYDTNTDSDLVYEILLNDKDKSFLMGTPQQQAKLMSRGKRFFLLMIEDIEIARISPYLNDEYIILLFEYKFGENAFNSLDKEYKDILINQFDFTYKILYKPQIFLEYLNMVRKDISKNEIVKFFAYNQKLCEIIVKDQLDEKILYNAFKLIEIIDYKYLPLEFQKVVKDALFVASKTNKINTIDMNPAFSYDLIKYIYPSLGLQITLDLLKYNSPAVKQIIDEVKHNGNSLVKWYIDFYQKHNLFTNDNKTIHYAFRYFSRFKDLLKSVKEHEADLDDNDINNLKKLFLNNNHFMVKNVYELKDYNNIKQKYIDQLKQIKDIDQLKTEIAFCFGYPIIGKLRDVFNGYQLGDYAKLGFIYSDIREYYGDDVLEKLKYTKKDFALIILIKKLIETKSLEELYSVFVGYGNQTLDFDYADDLEQIISKTRQLYAYQFNSHLTNVDNLPREQDKNGVSIITLDGMDYNFLVHRINNFDPHFRGYDDFLESNPELWDKLEGASTLSTSALSSLNNSFLEPSKTTGVIYMFNNIPNGALLYMYDNDLFTQHGNNLIKPESENNYYTDWDSLNQRTSIYGCEYNEVAIYRDNVFPCAFLCVGDKPNEETIAAAKYFSKLLNKDIPIIKIREKAYEQQKSKKYKNACDGFAKEANMEDLYSIYYDGITRYIQNEKRNFVLDCLRKQYLNGSVSNKNYIKYLVALESIIKRISGEDAYQEIKRIELLRQSIALVTNMTEEEIIDVEAKGIECPGVLNVKIQSKQKEYVALPIKRNRFDDSFKDIGSNITVANNVEKVLNPSGLVKTNIITAGKLKFLIHEKIEENIQMKEAVTNWFKYNAGLKAEVFNNILTEFVVDYLLFNELLKADDLKIDNNNKAKFLNKRDCLSLNMINSQHQLSIDELGTNMDNVYQAMFYAYSHGIIDLDIEILIDTVMKLESISDENYIKLFIPYLEQFTGKDKIAEKILKRKHEALSVLSVFVDELKKERLLNTNGR